MCEFFELSEARCGPGVDRLGQGLDVDATLFKIFQHIQEIERAPPQPVELPKYERVQTSSTHPLHQCGINSTLFRTGVGVTFQII